MELPTYTNIWKIEKRLYKLYDFRLPMPLPVGQIAAFLAIAVPYTVILTMVGMPFSHTWVWLYVLPPAVLAWLVTRPVLEGKRLPELVLSQLRYLGEPRTWCRMAPVAEKDRVVLVARVWRADRVQSLASASAPVAGSSRPAAQARPAAPARPAAQARPAAPARPEPWPQPARAAAVAPKAESTPAESVPTPGAERTAAAPIRARDEERVRARADRPGDRGPAPGSGSASRPPVIRVTTTASQAHSLNVVERALRTSPAERGAGGWPQPVVVVPGGHRPGKLDPLQRDQARARQPLPDAVRIMMLGCTAGAGQTTITLLTGQLLATLRSEAVAVVDFHTGEGSLSEQARLIPVLLPRARAGGLPAGEDSPKGGERGLQVVAAGGGNADAEDVITSVVARYPLVLADPDAPSVPRVLRITDQLILVAPASMEAAASLAMTLEWLDSNDHGRLAASAVAVLNGVSQQSRDHVDKAAAVVRGRCRAIIRVPWDDQLRARPGAGISAATIQAYTALAGVIVTGLADAASRSAVR